MFGQVTKETTKLIKNKDVVKNYTYDLLGRIRKETQTGSEDISYTYDSNNNRKEMTVGNKVTAYKYNKNDELLRTDTLNTETEEDSVVIYKNDRSGNQLATINRYEIPSDKKDETYVDIDVTLGDNRLNENVVNHYNAQNQLTKTLTKNYKVSFTYDAKGLRTSKTVNGEKTVFVWDGDQLVMELFESGKVKKRYIRGNDLVYADTGEETEKQYYVADTHGNVVQLTDENGTVTKTYEYDSFGNELKPDVQDDNPFRYCGEYYDKETEEIYLRARYYQPIMGRFLTRDIYTGEEDDPLSLHLYAYCGNDGVNSEDTSGHCYVVKNQYRSGNTIKQEVVWNSNCGVKYHKKYKHNRKIKDKYYLNAVSKIEEITEIKGFGKDLKKFKKAFKKNKKRYNKIAKKAKVPAQLIAAIHYRENTDDCLNSKFKIYLHNGQKLGEKTTITPIGKFFKTNQFNEAAIDAIKDKKSFRKLYKLKKGSKDMAAMLAFAETFNGRGYTDYHEGNNPYLYSGTNIYKKGKYSSDKKYDENLVDQQAGIFALIDKIF